MFLLTGLQLSINLTASTKQTPNEGKQMFLIYRTITNFYSKQLSKELSKRGCSTLALVLNQKRAFWTSKMFHSQGMVFVGFGE